MSLIDAITAIKTAEALYIQATYPIWMLFDLWLVITILIYIKN
jgi:hypothetical protein